MKRNIIIALCSAGSLLISCGNSNLPQIEESVARERARSIYSRQISQDFKRPDAYFINFHSNQEILENTFVASKISESELIQEFNWDLNKVACRVYDKKIYTDQPSITQEQIYFFDEKEDRICCAITTNGYKYYFYDNNPSNKGKEKSLEYLTYTYKDSTRGRSIMFSYVLASFDTTVDNLKIRAEQLKDKNDQYCKFNFGSKDEHSIQLNQDIKEELIVKKEDIDQKFDYKGYSISKSNDKYEDDLLSLHHLENNIDVQTENGIFYSKNHMSVDITTDKQNSKLNLPNLKDYVKEDDRPLLF